MDHPYTTYHPHIHANMPNVPLWRLISPACGRARFPRFDWCVGHGFSAANLSGPGAGLHLPGNCGLIEHMQHQVPMGCPRAGSHHSSSTNSWGSQWKFWMEVLNGSAVAIAVAPSRLLVTIAIALAALFLLTESSVPEPTSRHGTARISLEHMEKSLALRPPSRAPDSVGYRAKHQQPLSIKLDDWCFRTQKNSSNTCRVTIFVAPGHENPWISATLPVLQPADML